jgi:hypothetical protein
MIMRLAAAQRGMGDYDTAKAADWKKAVLTTLQRNSALPFALSQIQTRADEKTMTLSGTITGLAGTAGSPANIMFHLLDKDGATVASKVLTVPIPKKDDRQPFTITIDAPATAVSWKYEVQ